MAGASAPEAVGEEPCRPRRNPVHRHLYRTRPPREGLARDCRNGAGQFRVLRRERPLRPRTGSTPPHEASASACLGPDQPRWSACTRDRGIGRWPRIDRRPWASLIGDRPPLPADPGALQRWPQAGARRRRLLHRDGIRAPCGAGGRRHYRRDLPVARPMRGFACLDARVRQAPARVPHDGRTARIKP